MEILRNAMDRAFSNYTTISARHAQLGSTWSADHPERQLRRVLDYLGLDWSDELLTVHESNRTVRTPSAEQVRRPLNRSGVDRWKPYAQWLQPLRDALGPLADA